MNAYVALESHARIEPPSDVSFTGWWVVWRPRRTRVKTATFKWTAMAAFPTEAMALEWMQGAEYRSRDVARPLVELNERIPNAKSEE